jgi:cytoskeletal protein RodZ
MKEIGKMLKEKREKLNLTLLDAYKVIKIQEKYLKAIEDGDTSIFFAEVYYKSFVRSYSKFLGFDPEEVIDTVNLKYKQKMLEGESKNSETSKISCKNQGDMKKLLIILGIVVAIILTAFILFFNKKVLNFNNEAENFMIVKSVKNSHNDNSQELSVKQNEEYNSSENADDKNSGVETGQRNSDDILVGDKQQIKKPMSSNKREIEIIAKENVWIRLNKDGKTVYEGILNKGQRRVWDANKKFMLKMGYAPGLKVFFNGQEVNVVKNSVQDVNTIILE